MKTIHVVYKTHLDIGFTDLAQNVLNNYNQNYIPDAIELSYNLNKPGQEPQFIWTTGSYLIWQYLKNESEEKVNRLKQAIDDGYIAWHGLAATFHSEATGSEMFDFNLSIAQKLDEEFGKKTISGKMTDVPGHTKSIVPKLAKQGIKFLHIGMNGVSKIPEVPDNFIWESGGQQVYVSYSKGYGNEVIIDGVDDILYFSHTHDNSGVQSSEQIKQELEQIKGKYPDYVVKASTMDKFANVLVKSEPKLPVVTEEIGDTWIHGVSSDPKKMRDYYILTDKLKEWEEQGIFNEDHEQYENFCLELMLIPEHTWGMDIKRFFSDYKNYTKADFQKARQLDKITDEDLTYRYQEVKKYTVGEMKYNSFEWEDRSYKLFESSWHEQRNYITKAISMLPGKLQIEANKAIEVPKIDAQIGNQELKVKNQYEVNGWSIKINEFGALSMLEKDDVLYATNQNVIGELKYTIYGVDAYNKFAKNYLRNLDQSFWAIDFLKPGMEIQANIQNTEIFKPIVSDIYKFDKIIEVHASFEQEATEEFGAPRKIIIKYDFTDKLKINLSLLDKDAIRYPEGLSFKIAPNVNNPYHYQIEKLGQFMSPLDVVNNGNKIMHCIDNKVKYDGSDKQFEIIAIDSRNICIGEDNVLNFNNRIPKIENGFEFNLLNTIWGTNFTMWYEDDIHAEFDFTIN